MSSELIPDLLCPLCNSALTYYDGYHHEDSACPIAKIQANYPDQDYPWFEDDFKFAANIIAALMADELSAIDAGDNAVAVCSDCAAAVPDTEQHIRLHAEANDEEDGESFWGTLLTEDTARVENCLYRNDYVYGDTVRFEVVNGVREVREKLSGTKYPAWLTYEVADDATTLANYKKIRAALEPHGISAEGLIAGTIRLAVPLGTDLDQVISLCTDTGVPFEVRTE